MENLALKPCPWIARTACLLWIAVCAAPGAEAGKKWHRLPQKLLEQFSGRARAGMEIELKGRALQRVLRDFDFEAYQAEHPELVQWIPKEIVDHYLDDPANFSLLPKDLQRRLSSGLFNLNAVEIQSVGLEPAKLNPGETRTRSGLIVGGQGAERRTPPPPPPARTAGGLILPDSARSNGELIVSQNTRVQSEWTQLRARWHALPLAETRPHLRLDKFSYADREALLYQSVPGALDQGIPDAVVDIEQLKLRKELSPQVRQLYANLKWELDGENVEFTHDYNVVVSDLNAYLDQVEGFADHAGIADRLATPLEGTLESYHNHLSITGVTQGEERARAMNLTRFLEGLEGDFVGVMDNTLVAYRNIHAKGLYKLVAPDHVETRFLTTDPGTDLEIALRSMGEDRYAFDRLQETLARAITPETLRLMATRDKRVMGVFFQDLNDLAPHLPELEQTIQKMTRLIPGALSNLTFAEKDAFFKAFVEGISRSEPMCQVVARELRVLVDGKDLSILVHRIGAQGRIRPFDGILAEALRIGDTSSQGGALAILEHRPFRWSEELNREVLNIHNHGSDPIRVRATAALYEQQTLRNERCLPAHLPVLPKR